MSFECGARKLERTERRKRGKRGSLILMKWV